MEEEIKKLLEESKFVQGLPDNEKKLVMQNAQDIASDLLDTTQEDLDAFLKEKYPNAQIIDGNIVNIDEKLYDVRDLYRLDAVNNYLEGVENERFLKSSGIENDPNITGSNVLDNELDTSAKPKSSKLLSALKWLDPVEEAIAGMVTKIGLPSVAQAYVVAEAVNWFGNLTLEAARSKGELDLLNSKILTGQATDDEIKDFGKNIMSNLKQGVERAEKVSPSANVMNWIGKMLDR